MDWSFSGCGFLGVYHVGVASCLKEYSPQLVGRIFGASGGALAGCCLLCNCCLGEATSKLLGIVARARSRSLGPLHPSFNIGKVLRHGLNSVLPKNAHEIATGRLFISLTRVSDAKNVLISHYESKEELIDALLCSSFIPLYCGIIPPAYKGVRYLDGGITDNQPIFDENTITISPFAGEQDICPIDNSHSFFCFDITNTNVQISTNNIYRLYCALFPPQANVLSDMCKQGFEDTLRFLQRKSLMSCIRCLSIKAKINMGHAREKIRRTNSTRRSWLEKTKALLLPQTLLAIPTKITPEPVPPITCSSRLLIQNEYSPTIVPGSSPPNSRLHKHGNGKCRDCRIPLVQEELEKRYKNTGLEFSGAADSGILPHKEGPGAEADDTAAFMKNLPPVISNAFKSACQNMDRGFLNFLLNLPPMKLFAYYINLCLFPLDMFLHLTLRFLEWIPYLPGDMAWIFSHFIPLLRLFLKKIYDGKPETKASLTCEIAVSEMNFYDDYKAAVKADIQDHHDSRLIAQCDDVAAAHSHCRSPLSPVLKCPLNSKNNSTKPKSPEKIERETKVHPEQDDTNTSFEETQASATHREATFGPCQILGTSGTSLNKRPSRSPLVTPASGLTKPAPINNKNINFAFSLKWPGPPTSEIGHALIDASDVKNGVRPETRRKSESRRCSWYDSTTHNSELSRDGMESRQSSRPVKTKVKGGAAHRHSSHPCLSVLRPAPAGAAYGAGYLPSTNDVTSLATDKAAATTEGFESFTLPHTLGHQALRDGTPAAAPVVLIDPKNTGGAVMSYYYDDSQGHLRITEIYDITTTADRNIQPSKYE